MFQENSYKWFFDQLSPFEAHMHGISSIVFSKKTAFQSLEILDLKTYGLSLVLDGKIQSSELDESIYHEALVHPAMLSHPEPKKIFIIGGGEGATLREVLRYQSVEQVLMVDIDQEVVEACKTHLPSWHQGAFDDPRVDLRFLDARQYLEETNEIFDVIIIDISEPVEAGPAYLLYTTEFYQIVLERLNKDGLIALQAGTTTRSYLENFTAVCRTLKSVFPIVSPYQVSIPSFGLPWGFALASKTYDPESWGAQEIDQKISERIQGELQTYDGLTHKGQFLLSKQLRLEIDKEVRIIEDNHPLYVC